MKLYVLAVLLAGAVVGLFVHLTNGPIQQYQQDVALAEEIRDLQQSYCKRLPYESDEDWQRTSTSPLCRGEYTRIVSSDLLSPFSWWRSEEEREESREFLNRYGIESSKHVHLQRLEIARDKTMAEYIRQGSRMLEQERERLKKELGEMDRTMKKLRAASLHLPPPPPSRGGGLFFQEERFRTSSLRYPLISKRVPWSLSKVPI